MTYNLSDGDGNVAVIHTPSGVMPDEIRALLEQERGWITHNGTNFDYHWLQSYGVMPKGWHHDTIIGEQVLATTGRSDIKKDLGSTFERRLGYSAKKQIDHTGWSNPELTDEQVAYAAGDVEDLVKLAGVQMSLAKERGLEQPMLMEMELAPVVSRIGYNGLQYDHAAFEILLIDQLEKALEAQKRLGTWFNPNSAKQVKDYLASQGCFVENTRKETLYLLEADWPCVRDIVIMRQAKKRDSMYSGRIDKEFSDGNGIVRTNYWQVGANTTRFTSTNPNLQQIPRDFRPMFGNPDPAYQVVCTDYSQLEVRIVAELSRDPAFYDALVSEDLHTAMARVMWPTEEIDSLRRYRGKAGTFTWTFIGGVGGIQLMGAAVGMKISETEAKTIINNLNKRFPGVRAWHRTITNATRTQRVVTVDLPWGHKRHLVGELKRPPVVCNTMVQGTAAVGLKMALLECEKDGLTKYIGGLVHDEIVATNVPTNEADDYRIALETALLRGMSDLITTVPIYVESKIGQHWSGQN